MLGEKLSGVSYLACLHKACVFLRPITKKLCQRRQFLHLEDQYQGSRLLYQLLCQWMILTRVLGSKAPSKISVLKTILHFVGHWLWGGGLDFLHVCLILLGPIDHSGMSLTLWKAGVSGRQAETRSTSPGQPQSCHIVTSAHIPSIRSKWNDLSSEPIR